MVAPTKPQLVTSNGKDSFWFVPAVGTKTAPTVAEVNAVTGLNISCYLWADFEGPTGSTGKVTLPRLLCEVTQYEANDVTTYSLSDISFAFAPQAASGSDGKKAWEKFKSGVDGFLIRRQGIKADVDVAVTSGQFVDVIPVSIAEAYPGKTSTGADGVYMGTAAASITGKPEWNVAVAA